MKVYIMTTQKLYGNSDTGRKTQDARKISATEGTEDTEKEKIRNELTQIMR
jgi:hypothetical protein